MEAKNETKKEVKTEAGRKDKACTIAGCKRPYRAKGYCNVHYKKWRRGEMEGVMGRYNSCREEKCTKPTFKAGLCEAHYSAWSASKKPQPPAPAPQAPAEAPAAEEKPAEATA